MKYSFWGLEMLGLGLALLPGCAHKPPPPAPEPPEVGVSQPLERVVTDYLEYTGRTDAKFTVNIRSRVNGYLVKVNFVDGQYVTKDQLLYEIDPRPYEADWEKAKGNLAKQEGQKKLCQIQVDRYSKLVERDAASQQSLDEWKGKLAEAEGAVEAAKAEVYATKINVDFCTINSPIDGQISRTLYQIGNLVAPDQTTLTTITSVDPMYAYFSMDEANFVRVLNLVRGGTITAKSLGEVPVEMGLVDDVQRKFPLRGTMDFVNNQVDKQTATVTCRGVFANPLDLKSKKPPLLRPGMFIRIRVASRPDQKRFLVNERAIGTGQGYKFVWVLDEQNQVAERRVTLGQAENGLQVIETGLKAEDRVVVNGLLRCRAGARVNPKKVDMVTLAPKEEKAEGPGTARKEE